MGYLARYLKFRKISKSFSLISFFVATACSLDAKIEVDESLVNKSPGAASPAPLPTLSIDDVTAAEGAGTISFTITLSAVSAVDVMVDYAAAAGTALGAGVDYTLATGTATILAGNTTATVTANINNDALDEADETFSVTIANPISATIADSMGVGTITDEDPSPTLSIDDVTAAESAGTMIFTITQSAISGQAVTVNYAAGGGTATGAGSDYTLASGATTIAAGATTTTINVSVIDDPSVEGTETFDITLSTPTNATILDGTGVGTITDNDATLGAFSISGITGGSDAIQDAFLNGGVNPIVNWSASTNAASYDVTVYQSDGTTVECATQNTVGTSYNFSSCNLTAGSTYKAKVVSKDAGVGTLDAGNSLYSFRVNRAPTLTTSGPWYVLSSGSININAQWAAAPSVGVAQDADGDTLTFSVVNSPSSAIGSSSNNSTYLTYTANTYTGVDTFTFTVSDGNGATVSGTMTIHSVTAFTWSGGGGDANWTTAANWCGSINTDKTGCANNGAAPSSTSTTTHIAIFDGTCLSNCSANLAGASALMYGMRMNAGYSGTITQNSTAISVGAGRWSQDAGTFAGGSADITVSSSVSSVFKLGGGVFTSTSTILKIYCSGVTNITAFTHTGGTFSHNNGTVTFDGTYPGTMSATIDVNSSLSFYNLILSSANGSGYKTSWTIATGDILDVAHDLTFIRSGPAGLVYSYGGTIRVLGNVVADAGSSGGTTNVEFSGTSNQTYTSNNSGKFPVVVVNKTAGTVTTATTSLTFEAFTLTAGSFTAPSGELRIYPTWGASGNAFVVTSGTFSHNNGTLKFNTGFPGSFNFTIDVPISLNLNNLVYSNNSYNLGGGIWTIASGDTLNVSSWSVALTTAFVSNYVVSNGGTINVSGNITADESGRGGTTIVSLNGAGNQTYGSTNSGILPSVKIDKGSGTAASSTTDAYFHSLNVAQGTFTAPSGILGFRNYLSADNILVVASGTTFNHNNGTLTVDCNFSGGPTYTIDVPSSLTLNNFVVGNNAYNGSMAVAVAAGDTLYVNDFTFQTTYGGGGLSYLNTGTVSVTGNVLSGSKGGGGSASLVLAGAGNQTYGGTGYLPRLYVNKASGTVTSSTTDGYLTSLNVQQGSFTAPSGTLWIFFNTMSSSTVVSLSAGTSFNHNSGTVEFVESAAGNYSWTIDVDTVWTLNNLRLRPSSSGYSKTAIIAAGDKIVVLGTLDVQRTSGTAFFGINGGSVEVQGDAVFGEGSSGGTTAVSFTGGNNQSLSHSGGTLPTGQWTLNKSGGTFTQTTNATFGGAGHNLNVVNGTWDMNNFNLTNIGTLNIQAGAAVNKGSGTLGYSTCGGPSACP